MLQPEAENLFAFFLLLHMLWGRGRERESVREEEKLRGERERNREERRTLESEKKRGGNE